MIWMEMAGIGPQVVVVQAMRQEVFLVSAVLAAVVAVAITLVHPRPVEQVEKTMVQRVLLVSVVMVV
jgi:hypothetical protein